MSITTAWGNPEQTVIHLTFKRGWTWAQLKTAVAQADDLLTSVDHTVDLLIDIREAGGVPGDFLSAAGELFASGEARANEGRKIVLGAGPLIRTAYNGLVRVYGYRMKNRPFVFAANWSQAQGMLGL
ncbi:MAG: hypothetical protein H6671_17130 [Anaerolineaceae bacterium]|nr:hypothetical protein [Anaerolineaceae bacterium]